MNKAKSVKRLAEAAKSVREGWTPIELLYASSHGANAVRAIREASESAMDEERYPIWNNASVRAIAESRRAFASALAAVGLGRNL